MQFLKPDTCYHIFNHANGFENVFNENENFRYFLEKYRVYISPIAETYAYCLLPNHFHLVVRIRKREVIEELIRRKNSTALMNSSKVPNDGKIEGEKIISNETIEKYLSKQFSNLFSCYTQSFNKMYKRMGSLFIKNFKREIILDKEYFMNAVVYTHRNPIHHGFCRKYSDWGYCSYAEIIEGKSTIIEVEKLIKTWGAKNDYIEWHARNLEKFLHSLELDV
jgi:REP element-mobilizing transposase RayT